MYRKRQEELLGKSLTGTSDANNASPPASPRGPFRLAMEHRDAEQHIQEKELPHGGVTAQGAANKTAGSVPGDKGSTCDAV